MKSVYSFWISIVSLLLSIGAVVYVAPREGELSFDYLGLIVGVLALLVTALLAWQIYNAVSFHVKMDDLDERFTNLHDSCQKVVDECFDRLAKRNDEGLIAVRDMCNRNMEILSMLILRSLNHGTVSALSYAIEIVDQLGDTRGFIYTEVCCAISAFVSELAEWFSIGEVGRFSELVTQIPRESFCKLYSLDFEKGLNWEEGQIREFKNHLNMLSSNYPPTN